MVSWNVHEYFEKTNADAHVSTLQDLKKQLDFAGFLVVCRLDLLVTCKNLLGAKKIWEEIYYLRHGYLTIYEAIETYTHHSKWLNDAIVEQHLPFYDDFKKLKEALKHFRKDFHYEKTIRTIRHKITAHIDADFLNYFSLISGFNRDKALEAILAFMDVLKLMSNVSNTLAAQTSSIINHRSHELEKQASEMIRQIQGSFEALNGEQRNNV